MGNVMRQIFNISKNKIELIEEQIALDMIISGEAVPSMETMDEDLLKLEVGAAVGFPEIK
jgi:hypothetical protein